jgi:hypothetical protein
MYVEISYVGQTNNLIRSKFIYLSSKPGRDLDIRYFTKTPSVLSFSRSKDPVIKHMQSNILYSVNYKDREQTDVGKKQIDKRYDA